MASTSNGQPSLRRFQHLFRGRETVYGLTELNKQGEKVRSWCAQGQPTEQQWKQHLTGKYPGTGLGIALPTLENTCYFGAIDWDEEQPACETLAAMVEHAQLPLLVCRSKSGHAHLFLFLRDPAPAALVAERLRQFARLLKIDKRTAGKLAGQPVEIFPKNTKLKKTDDGTWINLPYYGNGATTRYAVAADGTHLTLAQFLGEAERKSLTSTALEAWAPPVNERLQQGPPCLQALDLIGYPEGTRNQGLFNVAIFLKLSNHAGWEEELRAYNQEHVDPPLTEREVQSIITSLGRKEYAYKCTEMPIQPHCEKSKCKRQAFGIDVFRKQALKDHMPALGHLRRITTDPPRWLVDVEELELELSTEDLMLLPRFRKAVLERCSLIFPLMKQQDWDEQLSQLLENIEVIEAPMDAGIRGQFYNLFREFLKRRQTAENRESLLMGLPFEEGSRVVFRSSDLMAFLERKKFKDYSASQVFTMLRSFGAGHDRLNVKGTGLQVWFVPTPKDEPVEPFTPTSDKEPSY